MIPHADLTLVWLLPHNAAAAMWNQQPS